MNDGIWRLAKNFSDCFSDGIRSPLLSRTFFRRYFQV